MQKDDNQHRRRDQVFNSLLQAYQKLAPVTDTFLFDIKQIDSEITA